MKRNTFEKLYLSESVNEIKLLYQSLTKVFVSKARPRCQ